MKRFSLILLLLFASTSSLAGSPKTTGMFSNMRFGTEDVTGVEVFITFDGNSYFAQVQCAEGAMSQPVLVPVQTSGTAIEFVVPLKTSHTGYSCPPGKFKGEISANGIKGQFEGTTWPGFLKRKSSYWQ